MQSQEEMMMMQSREENLMRSLTETTWRCYLWMSLLLVVVLWGGFSYIRQLRSGLIVTGMRDQISWGLYITNFVFFVGISHVGALLSAILRFSAAEWRRPLTRMAEAITFSSLFIAGSMPLIDMGRPDRLLNLLLHGRIQSPLLWDIISIGTYFTGSTLFLWTLLIPDIALLRDTYPKPSRWRKKIYEVLALGYRDTPEQHHLLERAILAVTLVILPLAISVHTVVSWIFAMTLRPGWDSTIFGPYFVSGALFSGAASVIVAMYIFRRVYRLQGYLKLLHFRNLGFVLLALTMLYLYFNINEYLTVGYKFDEHEKHLLESLFYGDFAFLFWTVQVAGVLVPFLLLVVVLGWKREYTIPGITLASVFVVIFAWVKRYLIIVPTLSNPLLPMQGLTPEYMHYKPTWVEWSITAGGLAAFLLIYTVLSKLFPIVSIWETREAEVTEIEVRPVGQPVKDRWGHIYPVGLLLIVGLMFASAPSARAAAEVPPKDLKPAKLLLEWEELKPAPTAGATKETEADPSSRVYLFLDRLFINLPQFFLGGTESEVEEPPRYVAIHATLLDTDGKPIAYQPVDFSFQTLYGSLSLGRAPTNPEGKAQLVIRDRQYGNGPIQVSYMGNDTYASIAGELLVDFGSRPARSLPKVGVLITPYATAAIALPFVFFYGTMWVVFIYAFGYLILWKMRRAGASGNTFSVPPPEITPEVK